MIAVVVILTYVSYNALNGLPFQSTYDINVPLPNADRLIATDDVKIAGVRVGEISSVTAEPPRGGRPAYALVGVHLDPSVGRLAIDTQAQVRSASVLGATYLALIPGHGRSTIAAGGTLTEGTNAGDLTDFFQIFKGRAAHSFQSSTADFAGGLAGEGDAFNYSLGALSALMPALTGVAQAMAAPAAHLSGFVSAFKQAFNALAPVSVQLSQLLQGAAQTFGALARVRPSLAAAIDAAPGAERASTVALEQSLPGLGALARLVVELRPAAVQFAPAFATTDSTLAAGIRALKGFPEFASSLEGTLSALDAISHIRSVDGAIRKATDLSLAGLRWLESAGPAQEHCNILALFTQGYGSQTAGLGFGDIPLIPTSVAGAKGNQTDNEQSAAPAPDAHINQSPQEDATACEAGNEPFNAGTRDLKPPPASAIVHKTTRATTPPPGVLQLANSAGLLAQNTR